MKTLQFSAVLLAGALASAVALAQTPTCPAYGSASGCNTNIVVNADGSLSITAGPGATPYDGSDDNLVGILNNSGHTVNSIHLSGFGADGGIFEFDGDGVDAFGAPGNAQDDSGYGGPLSYFSNITSVIGTDSDGDVNFIGGLANGAQTYFSLEDTFAEAPITPTPVGGGGGTSVTPEPSTFVLLGTGALGIAGSLRRRFLNR